MNTTNVMATNVSPNAKANTNNSKANTKAAKSNSKSKNFDDALGKLNDEGKDTFVPKDTQGSNAASEDNSGNGNENPSDTPLTANIIAAESVVINAPSDSSTAAVENSVAATSDMASALPLENAVSEAKTQPAVNLQTLLPQSETEAAQNKNFLAMLSGQTLSKENSGGAIKTAAASGIVNAEAAAKPIDVSSPLSLLGVNNVNKGATVLEAQLQNTSDNLPLNSAVAANNFAGETAVAVNSNLVNLTNTVAATAESTVQPSVTAASLTNTANAADDNNVSGLLGDADLTVEDAEPLRVMTHGTDNNAANSSFTDENNNSSEGEEALAKETVSLPSEGETNTESTTANRTENQVSSFQQHIQENVSALKSTENVKAPDVPNDNFDIPKQIVEQARLIRRGEDTQMVIKLNPEHLGELTLKVSVTSNGSVNASFHSDNTAVRTIIENSLVQLKQELNDQGLKVENVDVYAALDSDLPQDQGQQAWQNNGGNGQRSNFSGRNIDAEDYESEVENLAPVGSIAENNNVAGADGVDYRI